MDITINSMWTNDCQGKQDLDFSIVDCNTRYWPDNSALCEIRFLSNFVYAACIGEDPYVNSGHEPKILAESGIMHGSSEENIKEMVREWYNTHILEVMEKSIELIRL